MGGEEREREQKEKEIKLKIKKEKKRKEKKKKKIKRKIKNLFSRFFNTNKINRIIKSKRCCLQSSCKRRNKNWKGGEEKREEEI